MAVRTSDTIWEDTVDPTVSDDSTTGVQTGDDWRNTTSGSIWMCMDTSVGAAVWINISERLSGEVIVVDGSIALGDNSILVPPQITANTNDYDPAGFRDAGKIVVAFLVVDTSGNYNITGIAAPSPALKNRLILHNDGANTVSLTNNSGLSLAPNRFSLKGNITIQQQEAVELIYDDTISRWIALTL